MRVGFLALGRSSGRKSSRSTPLAQETGRPRQREDLDRLAQLGEAGQIGHRAVRHRQQMDPVARRQGAELVESADLVPLVRRVGDAVAEIEHGEAPLLAAAPEFDGGRLPVDLGALLWSHRAPLPRSTILAVESRMEMSRNSEMFLM